MFGSGLKSIPVQRGATFGCFLPSEARPAVGPAPQGSKPAHSVSGLCSQMPPRVLVQPRQATKGRWVCPDSPTSRCQCPNADPTEFGAPCLW